MFSDYGQISVHDDSKPRWRTDNIPGALGGESGLRLGGCWLGRQLHSSSSPPTPVFFVLCDNVIFEKCGVCLIGLVMRPQLFRFVADSAGCG